MRKSVLIVLMVFALALTASAQTKISGKFSFTKPDPNYSIDVPDRPGHALALQKTACTWTSPMEIAGSQSKEGTDVTSLEVSGATVSQRGYHTSTMANGDKFMVRYQGEIKMAKDGSSTYEGKWTFLGGTGQLKGIKGGGTYKGTGAADGTGTVDVEGDYTLPLAKAPAKAPAKKST